MCHWWPNRNSLISQPHSSGRCQTSPVEYVKSLQISKSINRFYYSQNYHFVQKFNILFTLFPLEISNPHSTNALDDTLNSSDDMTSINNNHIHHMGKFLFLAIFYYSIFLFLCLLRFPKVCLEDSQALLESCVNSDWNTQCGHTCTFHFKSI